MDRKCRFEPQVRVIYFGLALALSVGGSASAWAQTNTGYPWRPEVRCSLNPSKPGGLHPDAHAALAGITLIHRVTQGINHSSDRGNVHDTDVTIGGKAYTAAVDISVRCLTEAQIKALLGTLASVGFASWYRKNGEDDWTGPPHIHAVWSASPLKPVLRRQIESWLDGRNGLGSNRPYRFWQPDPKMKEVVRSKYRL
jgi:hypothetical protein